MARSSSADRCLTLVHACAYLCTWWATLAPLWCARGAVCRRRLRLAHAGSAWGGGAEGHASQVEDAVTSEAETKLMGRKGYNDFIMLRSAVQAVRQRHRP